MNQKIVGFTGSKRPDFIGDIHGHFDALLELLKVLGYERKNGTYSHPERIAVFVGDYIDRGPRIKETLELVQSMQEKKSAIALMGNHEFNFLCYNHTDENGIPHRANSEKNTNQCCETIKALKDPDDLRKYLEWMASLPIAIEAPDFRAVHAQWEDSAIAHLRQSGIQKFDQEGLRRLHKNQSLLISCELLLKGYEETLPEHLHFTDHEGNLRSESRVKWWNAKMPNKLGDILASLPREQAEKDISGFKLSLKDFYPRSEKPVFFGHYWMRPIEFGLTAPNACCVDFSIAKEGLLVAYRFSGEKTLLSENLVANRVSLA